MKLAVVEEGDVKVVEGSPCQELMSNVADTDGLIEACLSEGAGSGAPLEYPSEEVAVG